ncbi:transcriptional regulator NrdR [Candidatus Woesearchaeota archaeon]|nr:transcriptional regulator NrdR [Candidatus Woesearchaeota archaeon]
MQCPYCLNEETKVSDSREIHNSVRRRRECLKCSRRFTTYETAEIMDLIVVKKDKRREPFDRAKLIRGIMNACQKCPVTTMEIERMVDQIELELRQKDHIEVTSSEVGELVSSKLKQINKVAYIRFASVYREFTDVEHFKRELRKVLKA